eukprot:GAHX01001236.1.p1 GENE.GAHX01001236.1~~GAHX01001236.1.p1  ORF type:complete len:775 (-),score=181.22 GAHX01001236.1:406-2697(-)
MISSSQKLQDNYKELEHSEHRILNIVHNNHNLISNINKSLINLEDNINQTFAGINVLRDSNSLLLKRLKGTGTPSSVSNTAVDDSNDSYKNIKLFLIEGVTFGNIKKDFLSSEFIKAMKDIDGVLTNLSTHPEKAIFPFFQQSFRICVTLVADIANRLTPFFLLEIEQLEVLTCHGSFNFLNDYKQHMAFLEKYSASTFEHLTITYNKRKAVLIQNYLQDVNELLVASNKNIKSDLGYLDEIIGDNSLSLFLDNARIQNTLSDSFELTTSSFTINKDTQIGHNKEVDSQSLSKENLHNELTISTTYRMYVDLISKWNAIEAPSSFVFILESKNFTPTDKSYVFLFNSLLYDIIKLNKEFQVFETSFFNSTPCMSPYFTYNDNKYKTKANTKDKKNIRKSVLGVLNPFNSINSLNPFKKNTIKNNNIKSNKTNKNKSEDIISDNYNELSDYNNAIYSFLKFEIEKIENIFLLISISFNLDRITYKNNTLINSNQSQILFEKLSIDLLCRVKDKLNELPLILTKKSKISSFLFNTTNTAFKDIEYNVYLLYIFSSYFHTYNKTPIKDFPNLVLYRNLIEGNINILVNNTDELVKSISLKVSNMEDKMLSLIITNLVMYEFGKVLVVKEQNDYILKIYRNKLNELIKDYSLLLINGLCANSGNNKEKENWTFVRWKNVVIDFIKKLFSKTGEYCAKNKVRIGNGVRIYTVEYVMDSFILESNKQRRHYLSNNEIDKESEKEEFMKKLMKIKCQEINSLMGVYKMSK